MPVGTAPLAANVRSRQERGCVTWAIIIICRTAKINRNRKKRFGLRFY
ncbi:hypothetical protein GCM10027018_21210 [Paenibacillus thermoaerophilus]